jgi:hypothetical protein
VLLPQTFLEHVTLCSPWHSVIGLTCTSLPNFKSIELLPTVAISRRLSIKTTSVPGWLDTNCH